MNAYPYSAGFKGQSDTGRLASEAYQPQLGRRQRDTFSALCEIGPASAEEIGEKIGLHWYLTRPRLSELRAMGLATDSGDRGKGALGGKVIRWRVTTPEERAAFLADKEAGTE